VRYGILEEDKMKLDYVLDLKPEDFFKRRLQTQVFLMGLAKSIHHARVLIKHRHVRVRNQLVNVPSFMVRLDSAKHIDFSLRSPFGGGRPGRKKRSTDKRKAAAAADGGGGDGESWPASPCLVLADHWQPLCRFVLATTALSWATFLLPGALPALVCWLEILMQPLTHVLLLPPFTIFPYP